MMPGPVRAAQSRPPHVMRGTELSDFLEWIQYEYRTDAELHGADAIAHKFAGRCGITHEQIVALFKQH